MSSKELNDLVAGVNTPDRPRLRSGKERPEAPLNSTNTDKEGVPLQAPSGNISSIRPDSSLSMNSYRDSTASYMESPVGKGSGTLLMDPITRAIRTSEDNILDPITFDGLIEDIRAEIEWFSLDLVNIENWQQNLPTHFRRIDDKVKSLLAKVSIAGDGLNMTAIARVTSMNDELHRVHDELKLRALSTQNGTQKIHLRKSNLSVRLTDCTDDSNGTDVHDTVLHEEDNVFQPTHPSIDARIAKMEREIAKFSTIGRRVKLLETEIVSNNESIAKLSTTVSEINKTTETTLKTSELLSMATKEQLRSMKETVDAINQAF